MKINAEGNELVLSNEHGDIIIIPKNKRSEALKHLNKGNHQAIDDMAKKLPYMNEYAKNGSLFPEQGGKDIYNPKNWVSTQSAVSNEDNIKLDSYISDRLIDIHKNEKPSFDDWYKTIPEDRNDTATYDLQGAYKDLPYEDMIKFSSGEAHLPDTYKKPNHITFSTESKYSTKDNPGGEWKYEDNQDVFYASKANIDNAGGEDKLQEYFNKYEKGVKLVIREEKKQDK